MDWYITLALITIGLMVLLATGMPVAFAFMVLNLILALILFRNGEAIQQIIQGMSNSVSSFVFAAIPLYTFMGFIIFKSGMASRAIDAIDNYLGKIPGRLSIITVIGGAVIGTMMGSVVAAGAILASTMLPEMLRRGYKKPLSVGPIMASGGLDVVVPPSGLGIIMASMMGLSVSKFYAACLLPALLMATNYIVYIIGRCSIQRDMAPVYDTPPKAISEVFKETVYYILPLSLVIFGVLGTLFLGIATPSESAAAGCFAALVLAAAYRKLNWGMVKGALYGSVRIAVLMMMIIIGSSSFSRLLAFSGTISSLSAFAVSIPAPTLVIHIIMLLIVLFLGTALDGLSMAMITIPIFLPVLSALHINLMWFALTYLIAINIGGTSPPTGNILFVVKSMAPADFTMNDLYKAAYPFILCDVVSIALIMLFPSIVLWLPGIVQ